MVTYVWTHVYSYGDYEILTTRRPNIHVRMYHYSNLLDSMTITSALHWCTLTSVTRRTVSLRAAIFEAVVVHENLLS